MDKRNTILYQIKDTIIDKLTKLNGYNFTPKKVERGIFSWNDMENNMPAILFTFISETPYESPKYQLTYDDTDTKNMKLMFYGYAKTDGYGKSDLIFQMAQDVMDFLKSDDFTLSDDIIINNVEIKEGGINDPINSFLMEVNVIYDYNGVIHSSIVDDGLIVNDNIE